MELKDKIKLNRLYDIYGGLLTLKQKEYYEYYYLNDYSLSEIADILKVSRNAVHIQLKNVIKHLEHYEEKLHVLEMKTTINKIINKINNDSILIEEIKSELEKV